MKRLKMATWLALLLLAELVPARPDMILKVPKVRVRHEVVPRPVGTRSTFDTTPNTTDADEVYEQTTKTYIEHEVTLTDARKAMQLMKIFWISETLPGCGKCSRQAMEYCEFQMLDDHCCCERRYQPEPFSWLPHICMMGPERCTIHAPNCAQYTRLRDCCCNKKLAEKWKAILSRASQLSLKGMSLLFISMVLFSLYI